MSWAASWMPRLRDQTRTILTDPDSPLRRAYANHHETTAGIEHAGRALAVADLYWVAPAMAALAVAAAGTLPQVRWTAEDRPSPLGLIIWDGGVGTAVYDDQQYPVDAASWGPHPEGLLVMLYLRRSRLADSAAEKGLRIDTVQVPPLVPLGAHLLPVTAAATPVDELDGAIRTILTTLAASWNLMQQPSLADRIPVEVDRKIRAAYRRAGSGDPQVSLVALRREYQLSGMPPLDPDQPGRHYLHRWVVRGHWRQQAHGPDRALRRQTWIPAHVKGPEGADLLIPDKVNVWRR